MILEIRDLTIRQFNLTEGHLDPNQQQEHCHACAQPTSKAVRRRDKRQA